MQLAGLRLSLSNHLKRIIYCSLWEKEKLDITQVMATLEYSSRERKKNGFLAMFSALLFEAWTFLRARKFYILLCQAKNPTKHFTILEPQNQGIVELYEVQERRETYFEA